MPVAFVLINAELDSEKYIIEQLNKIECVTNVDSVYGVYDLVVKIESTTMEEVKNIISYFFSFKPLINLAIDLSAPPIVEYG